MTAKIRWSLLGAAAVLGSLAPASTRIVGGTAATAGEFPFIASLQRGSSHFCGGTLIAKNWILTAAHCTKGLSASSLTVKLGLINLSDSSGVERFTAKRVIVHPNYNAAKTTNDYSLVELNGESKFTPAILNAMDLLIDDEEADALRVVVAGWGTLKESGSVSQKLMKVEVPLVPFERCNQAYGGGITDTMICAGLKNGGKDSCQGDSGGPLVVRDYDRDTDVIFSTQVGIVSSGRGCAWPGWPGVYTRLSAPPIRDFVACAVETGHACP